MQRLLMLLPPLAVLAAAAAAAPPKLKDVCSLTSKEVNCSCSHEHPVIDVVSSDTQFLAGAEWITFQNCRVVKLGVHALEKTAGLQGLRIIDVSDLELDSPLPSSVKTLFLNRIGYVASIPVAIFQVVEIMETVMLRDVGFREIEPHFLDGVKTNYTEIRKCRFPNLDSESLYVESVEATVSNNTFVNLSANALTMRAEKGFISENYFEYLADDSIQWNPPEGVKSELLFQRNTIELIEKNAFSGLREGNSDVSMIDNVLLCLTGNYNTCRESVAVAGDRQVCDAEVVCPYRNRTDVTEQLAEAKRCAADAFLSEEACAVLAVGNKTAGAGGLRAASPVISGAVALLATVWFSNLIACSLTTSRR